MLTRRKTARIDPSTCAPESVNAANKRAKNLGSTVPYYGVLALIAIVPYLNTLWNGFVYDDIYQVLGNPYIRSFHYLRQILTTSVWSFRYAAQGTTNYYRPLMSLDYLLLYQIYGPLAYGFHLANLLTHAVVVLLLFAITNRLTGSKALAFVAAALFALHPVHVEAVAWVAAIPDLQLAMFLLVAFWLYLDLAEAGRRRWWTWPALLATFALALICKEPAAAFPFIALGYETFVSPSCEHTTWRQKAGRVAPLFTLLGIYLGLRAWFMGGLVPRLQKPEITWPVTFLSSASLFNDYMNKLIWPVRLMASYVFVPAVSFSDPRVIAGVAWGLALCLASLLLWKQSRLVAFSVLWMVLTLAPVMNARWLPTGVFAERYLYVPSIGLSWLVAYGAVTLWQELQTRKATALRLAFAGAAVLLSVLATLRIVTRNRDWHDDITFYRVTSEQDPDSASLKADLGAAYWNMHQEDTAERQWKLALTIDPNNTWALFNLGIARLSHKQYPEAVGFLRRTVATRRYYTDAHLNLAIALAQMGDISEAESEFQLALKLSPLSADAHNHYAVFLAELGRTDEAQAQYLQSVAALPTTDALDRLGDLAIENSRPGAAELYFQQAASLDRFDSHAHLKLVCLYAASGKATEAAREYQLGEMTDTANDSLNLQARAALDQMRR